MHPSNPGNHRPAIESALGPNSPLSVKAGNPHPHSVMTVVSGQLRSGDTAAPIDSG